MRHGELELDDLLTSAELESGGSDSDDPYAELEGSDYADPEDEPAYELETDEGVEGEWQEAAEQDALAYEFMGVNDDAEMEEFFGKLVRRASRGLKQLGKQALPHLVPLLKGPARDLLKRAMPLVGSAMGSVVPGAGTLLGGMAGRQLGQLLGGEMENASDDEARLDLSRRLVNTVSEAVTQAAEDPRSSTEPDAAARDALVGAVNTHLPGGVRRALMQRPGGKAQGSGRWIRRGRTIVLLDV